MLSSAMLRVAAGRHITHFWFWTLSIAYPLKCRSSSCNDSKMVVTKVKFTPLHYSSGNNRQGDQRQVSEFEEMTPSSSFRWLAFGHALPRGLFILLSVPIITVFFLQLPRAILPTSNQIVLPCKQTDLNAVHNDTTICIPFHRSLFPEHFVFGTATAAYQVEGAYKEGGRELTIWDTFSCTPGKILDGSNGTIASDQYHKYQEDIGLMSELNVDAYRFSIAWSRIMKYDGLSSGVNKEGIAYYNNLIDGLLKKGIQPYVTLYHWDLPQSLYDMYSGGWIDQRIVNAYADYAEACFTAFGDRVKHWITFNEPQQFSVLGYGAGVHAPGRCSDRSKCNFGNTATEPYLAAHHALLAHAAAVDVYKRKFQATQGGLVGISLDCEWGEPMTNSEADRDAAQRHVLFQLGWFLDPIYFGDYPAVMRSHVGDRLPVFTANEVSLLRGSLDFIGLNHYTSRFVASRSGAVNPLNSNFYSDQMIQASVERNNSQIGLQAASEWLYIVPWGLGKVLLWLTQRYNQPVLYVTENGMDDLEGSKPIGDLLSDTNRIAFYEEYLTSVLGAIRGGADIRGYFAWSLMDNFEWAMGYTRRFGLIYVDYANNQKRILKQSATWYSRFLRRF